MSKWNPFRDEDLSKKQTILAVGLVFVVAGISGWVYEELFYRLNDGVFSWRGHGVGPWLPIYAFGTLILLFATAPVKDSKWKTVLLCALLSGGFEFLVGWALYHLYDPDEYFYDHGDPELSAGAASDVEELSDALFICYLGFTPLEAEEFHTMSAGRRSAFLEEKLEQIVEERKGGAGE